MPATVRINEYNGTTAGTATTGITNSNFVSTDAANATASAFPITAGSNSFEKYQKLEVTAMGGSSVIKDIKVWYTGTLAGSDALLTNARTATYTAATAATPVATASTVATQAMPSAAPGTANLGIAGSLTGSLTGVGTSDFLVMQLQVNAATTAGATLTINWRYTEVA